MCLYLSPVYQSMTNSDIKRKGTITRPKRIRNLNLVRIILICMFFNFWKQSLKTAIMCWQ